MDSASTLATATAILQVVSPPSPVTLVLHSAKDLALAGAAVVGAYVAWKGLHAWRDQLTGQTEYDLAKRLLRLFYRYRDAVAAVRHPHMPITEMFSEADGLTAEEQLARSTNLRAGLQHAYDARWSRVHEVRADLYPELLEAEALWGPRMNELAQPLFALEDALSDAVLDYLAVEFADPGDFRFNRLRAQDAVDSRFALMYEGEPGEDSFVTDFGGGLDAIANHLSHHLRR